MAGKKARILVDHLIGALQLGPNNLVSGTDATIKALVKSGVADDSTAAVKYCESQGYEAINIKDLESEKPGPSKEQIELAAKIEAANNKVSDLREDLAAAEDDKKPEIEAQLQIAEDELQALNK